MELPLILTEPPERSRPSARHLISVVLPAPFGPTRLTSSPRRAEKATSESTERLPKCLETPETSTTTSAAEASAAFHPSVASATVGRLDDLLRKTAPSASRRLPKSPAGSTTITTMKQTPTISSQTKGRLPER